MQPGYNILLCLHGTVQYNTLREGRARVGEGMCDSVESQEAMA